MPTMTYDLPYLESWSLSRLDNVTTGHSRLENQQAFPISTGKTHFRRDLRQPVALPMSVTAGADDGW